jgi:hypothetical protein
MQRIQTNDDNYLVEGEVYSVGTSDGREFNQMIFTGKKNFNGKPMMTFKKLQTGKSLVINPSYHAFSMEEEPEPLPEDLESRIDVNIQNTIKGDYNG